MAAYGLLQPVLVRPLGAGYELADGHRRFAAAQQLGWKRIPAVVRDVAADGQAYLLTLTANLQRQDLSPKRSPRRSRSSSVTGAGRHARLPRPSNAALRVPDLQERKALAKQAAREQWTRTQARAAIVEDPAVVRGVTPDADPDQELRRSARLMRQQIRMVTELSTATARELLGLRRDLADLVGD